MKTKTKSSIENMVIDELLIQRTLGHVRSYYFVNFQTKVGSLTNQICLYSVITPKVSYLSPRTVDSTRVGRGGHGELNHLVFSPVLLQVKLGMAIKRLGCILASLLYCNL